MNNIYYVGRRIDSAFQRDLPHQNSFKTDRNLTPRSGRQTSVSSCRKTEPKYAHLRSIQQGLSNDKRRTDRRMNTEYFSPSREAACRVVIKRKDRPIREQCSAISMQSMQGKVRFNRVQQPETGHVATLLSRIQNHSNRSTQRKCEKPFLKQPPKENKELHPPHEEKITQQEEASEYSELARMYKLQPQRRLFLCDSCLFYLPFIEIQSHHMQCRPAKSRHDFLGRWERLTELLVEIHRMRPANDELFRLCELMTAYPGGRRTKLPTPSIYSQELERILRYQLLVNIPELKIADLFQVVEKVADRLETLREQPSKWLLCS